MKGKWFQAQGSALIIIVMIMFIFMVLGTGILVIWSVDMAQVRLRAQKLQAYYIARSGADALGYYFENNPDNLSNTDLKAKLDAIVTSESSTQQSDPVSLGAGWFQLHVFRETDNPRMIDIVSTGKVANVQQQVTLVLEETPEVAYNPDGSIMFNADGSIHYNYTWSRIKWISD